MYLTVQQQYCVPKFLFLDVAWLGWLMRDWVRVRCDDDTLQVPAQLGAPRYLIDHALLGWMRCGAGDDYH